MRFVFVHGGFHAAWCWDRTIAELRAARPRRRRRRPAGPRRPRRRGVDAGQPPGRDRRADASPATCWSAIPAADSTPRSPPMPRPDLVSHIVYLAAALPREGRTYPEAMAMRDDGDDWARVRRRRRRDVGLLEVRRRRRDDVRRLRRRVEVLLPRLRRGDRALGVRPARPRAVRRHHRHPGVGARSSGRPTCPAASSCACRTGRCRAGWPTRSRAGSASSS